MAIIYYADQDVKGNITLGGNLIFDTGGNALITTSGGDLTLQTSTDDIFLIAQDDISLAVNGGDVGVYISGGGGTSLRYNNSQKLITTSGGVALDDGLYIPNYIYHNGNTGTYIGYPSTNRFTIATGSGTRADFTNAGFSLGDYQTNVSANIILDEDNMGSNSATALVTQQSVKAYVDAHTSGIGGSGTTNSIPMFTAGTTIGNSAMSQANIGTGSAKRITVSGARMTITGNGGDADGGTLNLSSNTARLGIATNSITGGEPEASLDVGKNARVRGSLNVGPTTEQYLFVSTTGDNPVGYVKMGYYGSGVEWGSSTSTTRTPQYSTGFGSGGKVVEDARYYTFKISFTNMATIDTTPRVLIAQDTGPYTYIVEDFYIFQDNASAGQVAPYWYTDLRLDYKWTPAVGTARTSTAWVVPQATMQAARTRRTLMQGVSAGALSISDAGLQEGSNTAYARASIVLTATSVASTGNSGDYYLRLKVKKVNITNDILNNTETITIT